jgi:hypothetical protein
MLAPVDRPLGVGEIVAETIRLYGRIAVPLLGVGALQAGVYLAAVVLPGAAGVVVIALGFVVGLALVARLAVGDSAGAAVATVGRAVAPVLLLGAVVGIPWVIAAGLVDPFVPIVSSLWLAIAFWAVPVTLVELAPRGITFTEIVGRTRVLAGVGFLHALGTVFVLSLIRFLVGVPLFLALEGYADQTQQAALALVQVILAPFLFVGLVVLYTETVARHERDDVPRRRPR